jgi:DNA-directed RNA polymerase specialized sigma24 family protein
MEWLTKVAKEHKEWVKIVHSFGEYFYADDIVQECYLRLHKYCKPENVIQNDKINKGFMYFVLRNTYLTHVRSNGRNETFSLSDTMQVEDTGEGLEKEKAYGALLELMDKEIATWHYYDQMLFEVYKNTDLSIRDISKETTISVSSIFNTLKNCKSKLKKSLKEDYEDFKNKDYELINK